MLNGNIDGIPISPGPWQAYCPDDEEFAAYVRAADGEEMVAVCAYGDEKFNNNARLIAAAPELFWICQHAARLLTTCVIGEVDWEMKARLAETVISMSDAIESAGAEPVPYPWPRRIEVACVAEGFARAMKGGRKPREPVSEGV